MDFYNRDIQIMRQSQTKMAFEYILSLNVTVSVEELQRITDIFVEYCLRPSDDDLKKRVKALDAWLKTKQSTNDVKTVL